MIESSKMDDQDAVEEYFLRILRELHHADRLLGKKETPFFRATVTLDPMEIPEHFVYQQQKSLYTYATLRLGQYPVSSEEAKNWPVNILIPRGPVRGSPARFCSLWTRFITVNGLQPGDEVLVTHTPRRKRFRPDRSWQGVSEFVVYTFEANSSISTDAREDRPEEAPACKPIASEAKDDWEGDLHFIKTMNNTSDSENYPAPHLEIPASFWRRVELPLEVNMQGPNCNGIFRVPCSSSLFNSTVSFKSSGWKPFHESNKLKAGDTLKFTYTQELELFKVDYAQKT